MKMAYQIDGKTCDSITVGGTYVEVSDVHWKYSRRHNVQIVVDDGHMSHCLRLTEEQTADLICMLGVSLKEVKRRNRP
jgi:hypothetical protein